ncbi:hypothetical protein KIT90_20510 [Vibrio sp. B172a]|uniref:hypothetical protein n=1 Tax=Vibrio sp. B172a TaxID=2835790 RepID=UPI002554294E|nr:hypothetical protein [Vibrio sp. B172a]MDK9783765.1 hypothetical protein [Vibrio sp. B172a]
MLNIMYGMLPFDSQLILGDMKDKDQLKKLIGLSYQDHAILKVKFISNTSDGLIFCALIDTNDKFQYPLFQGKIERLYIDKRQQRFCLTPSFSSAIDGSSISIHARSSNAARKRYRKEHNQVLTQDNWKQFVRKRKSILSQFTMPSNHNVTPLSIK